MNILKSIWGFLDNKKSPICAVLGVGLAWAEGTGHISAGSSMYLAAGLTAITGVAVGHKIVKAASE